jgi:ureidoglycolate dehydrogenase (NAD+)
LKVTKEQLSNLIIKKLTATGLQVEFAEVVADVLVFADSRGINSHGSIRVEYYCERISKGGININPSFEMEKVGPSAGIFHGDNGPGHVAAKKAMDEAIKLAKETGIGIVGVRQISHSGALSYFVRQAASKNMIGLSFCQADPMAVPYGGAEPYYGTNPIAFAAPGQDNTMITFDMATTEKAWGKILQARSKNEEIPIGWAVDNEGKPTTDPFQVSGLSSIAGPKGFGLAMMVDILSGVLLGLPFGNRVSALYGNLTEGRNLGQMHFVINPEVFTDLDTFKQNISQTMKDLNNIRPAFGFEKVYYPGQRSELREAKAEEEGIDILDDVYEYLTSDRIHSNKYGNQDAFGNIVKN